MFLENPKVMRCQKCQKSSEQPFGTFVTLSVSTFGETTRPLGSTQLREGVVLRSHPYVLRELLSVNNLLMHHLDLSIIYV